MISTPTISSPWIRADMNNTGPGLTPRLTRTGKVISICVDSRLIGRLIAAAVPGSTCRPPKPKPSDGSEDIGGARYCRLLPRVQVRPGLAYRLWVHAKRMQQAHRSVHFTL